MKGDEGENEVPLGLTWDPATSNSWGMQRGKCHSSGREPFSPILSGGESKPHRFLMLEACCAKDFADAFGGGSTSLKQRPLVKPVKTFRISFAPNTLFGTSRFTWKDKLVSHLDLLNQWGQCSSQRERNVHHYSQLRRAFLQLREDLASEIHLHPCSSNFSFFWIILC